MAKTKKTKKVSSKKTKKTQNRTYQEPLKVKIDGAEVEIEDWDSPWKRKSGSQLIKDVFADYTPAGLSMYDEKLLRTQYSRLRTIMEKRLASYVRAGTQKADFYQQNRIKRPFLKINDLKKERVNDQHDLKDVLTHELNRLIRELNRDDSSNAAMREVQKIRVEKLKNLGIKFLDTDDKDFDAKYFAWEELVKETKERGLGNIIYLEQITYSKGRRQVRHTLAYDAETTELLFNLWYEQKQDGLDYFVDNILPTLKQNQHKL